MKDRISEIINNLLDEAVIAASRSDWREVIRLCKEVRNLDQGNADAVRMIEAAEANLKPPELESIPDTAAIRPSSLSKNKLQIDYIRLSSRQGWAKFTVGATVVALIASILATISEINLIIFIENFNNLSGTERWELTGSSYGSSGNTEVLARIQRNDGLQVVVSFVSFAAYLASVVSFLAWLQATSKNLSLVRGTPARFSPGWVIGWWFIPLANLFKPYQIMKDVWVGSVDSPDTGGRTASHVWPWLGWFWGSHLTGNIIAWWSLRTGSEDLQSMLAGDYIALVGNVFTVAAGVILFVFIVKVTDGQENWHASASQKNTTHSTL